MTEKDHNTKSYNIQFSLPEGTYYYKYKIGKREFVDPSKKLYKIPYNGIIVS